ncbi:MAG: integrase [Sphingomonas sp.]|nr:MAG: integrase [Sphingomonas sp.]
MPRTAKGPRLYWRADKAVWLIRDTGRADCSTGTSDRRIAEGKLAAYIASKDTVTSTRSAEHMPVAEVLDIYAREHAVTVAAPGRIGSAIGPLLDFWGTLNVADVKGETCRRYCKSRIRRFKDKARPDQPISNGTLRRELNVLQAAINYCDREGYLLTASTVTLPKKPSAKDRWLTRDEAATLLREARNGRAGGHLPRFILLAIYTGTRKDAILRLGFNPSIDAGWIDVSRGVMYRKGAAERDTKKRRKPVRLIPRLLAHCRRWKATGVNWAIEIDGQRVGDIKHAFEGASDRAGMPDVTPHTLKHTAITWAIQRGLTVEDAADYFDTSPETIRRVYYHHSPHYQDRAVEVLSRKL